MYILANVNYGRNLLDTIPNAKDFQYWEFVSSETAVRNGIANIPSEEEWQNIEYLAVNLLQPLRDKIGKPLKVNSGFRCDKLNSLVGSSPASFHRLGCAADIDSDEIALIDMMEIAMTLPYTEAIAEFYPHGWNHLAIQKGRTDQTLKLKDSNHNYSHISFDELRELYGM